MRYRIGIKWSPRKQRNGAYPNPNTKRTPCVEKYLLTYQYNNAVIKSFVESICLIYRPCILCILKIAAKVKNNRTAELPLATNGCGINAVARDFSTLVRGDI
ncbi:Hypothetical_protein [Hexamita inflata]|uniref:Hypothetical_protein n=1 Tax=Hexamita inflata TaxID=28002 RepID=A0AA86TXS5_9EUKA|nr:Hypothetical protein HINF_LOCUS19996 [Hexamita inflata]